MPHPLGDNFFEHRKRSVRARRQDRRFLIALMVLLGALIFGGGGYMFLGWVSEGAPLQYFRTLPLWNRLAGETPKDQTRAAPIPLVDIPTLPQPLQAQILRSPREICQRVNEMGFKTEGWQHSPLQGNGWECLAERELQVKGEVKASVFFAMRGKLSSGIDTLRLKFNLPAENEGRKAYANQLADIALLPLFDFFSWQFPQDLMEKIRALDPFETVMDGVKLRLFSEFGSNQHINLQLFLPRERFQYREANGELFATFSEDLNEPYSISQQRRVPDTGETIGNGLQVDTPLVRNEDGVIIPQETTDQQSSALTPEEEIVLDESVLPKSLRNQSVALDDPEALRLPQPGVGISVPTQTISKRPEARDDALITDDSADAFSYQDNDGELYGQFVPREEEAIEEPKLDTLPPEAVRKATSPDSSLFSSHSTLRGSLDPRER